MIRVGDRVAIYYIHRTTGLIKRSVARVINSTGEILDVDGEDYHLHGPMVHRKQCRKIRETKHWYIREGNDRTEVFVPVVYGDNVTKPNDGEGWIKVREVRE